MGSSGARAFMVELLGLLQAMDDGESDTAYLAGLTMPAALETLPMFNTNPHFRRCAYALRWAHRAGWVQQRERVWDPVDRLWYVYWSITDAGRRAMVSGCLPAYIHRLEQIGPQQANGVSDG